MRFARLPHGALLLLTLVPAAARAQSTPAPSAAPPGAHAGAAGVEVGAGSMVVAIFPAVGGHVSVPTGRRVRMEVAAHVLPWLLEDDDVGIVTQVQARIPFRDGPPGSRRSLLVGASAFTIGNRRGHVRAWDFDTGLRPHAGVSWQWQKSRYIDVRIDVHGVFTGLSAPFVVPFATFSMVFHGERRWQ